MKRILRKTFALFTGLFILSSSLAVGAVDLNYSGGSTSNNTGASGTTSGYQIAVSDPVYGNNVGYRFSVVNGYGELKYGSNVANIYLDSVTNGSNSYYSAQRFVTYSGGFANKKQLANNTSVVSAYGPQSCEYLAGDADFYYVPGQNPSDIRGWIQDTAEYYKNLGRIYLLCGLHFSNVEMDDYILIEPILRVKLAGVITAATPTELAVYGASVSGGGWYNGANGKLSNTGSGTLWNLQYYINREFPNLLYVNSDITVYSAVSVISSGRYTYDTIIQNGYGCAVLAVKNVVPIKRTHTNTITHWKYVGVGGDNGDGSFKNMGTSYFSGKCDDWIYIPDSLIQYYSGYYCTWSAGSFWGTDTWSNKNIGSYFLQPDYGIGIDYYYYPKSVNVVFNMNDGSGWTADQTFTYAASGNRFGYNNDGTPCWANNSGQFGGWDKEGYTLLGWSESPWSSDVAYSIYSGVADFWINEKVPDPNTYGTVNLYAVWEKNSYVNTIAHWAWGFNGNGNNGNGQAFRLDETTNAKQYGESFVLDESSACTVPNGFNVDKDFGSDSVTGVWSDFPFGTAITQNAGGMYFEYDYSPIDYSISYDLDGGTNNPDNPAAYNVLYGKNLSRPTKTGYEFLGWTREENISKTVLAYSDWNYTFKDIIKDVEPGTSYDIEIGSAKAVQGTQTAFSCAIYDFTDSSVLFFKNISFGDNISFTAVCPSNADSSHDIRLLFYSGISGSTGGMATEYSNIKVSFYTDGINKGCGSDFANSADLYSELEKRSTGNVKLIAKWKKILLVIVPIEPNAPYREDTEVVTSFWIVNASTENYIPSDNIKVVFTVCNKAGTVIKTLSKAIVVPARDKNLVYFKWKLPEGLNGNDVTVKAVISGSDGSYGLVSKSYATIPYIFYITPDTEYEAKAPDGFSVPDAPADTGILNAKWWEYKYENGAFRKINYGIGTKLYLSALTAPDSASAVMSGGKLTLRSGYGFRSPFGAYTLGVEGYTMPDAESYTERQYAYALFPEFNYGFGENKCRTFKEVMNVFDFYGTDGNPVNHYIPLYYPDGEYTFRIEVTDNWTPAGMITSSCLQTVTVSGSLYDDWYIGRK